MRQVKTTNEVRLVEDQTRTYFKKETHTLVCHFRAVPSTETIDWHNIRLVRIYRNATQQLS